jgi:hypothetical protein
MRQILRHTGYATLVLLGAIVQMDSTAIVKSLGIRYADDMTSFLLLFLGALAASLIIFEVLLIANRWSSKANGSSAIPQSPVYNLAIESRNTVIEALRRKLLDTENELNLMKRSFPEIESRVGSLGTERDALKQSNRRLEIKLKKERQKVKSSQSRMKELKKEQNGFRRASEIVNGKLAQELQKSESSQIRIDDVEKERDGLKQVSDRAKRELEQERQKVDDLQKRMMNLEQEMRDSLEIISTDLMNGDTVVLLSAKAWKDRGDNNEIEKWKGLFSKIKNPLLRSQQERPDGDGFVYPRGAEARRVRYLREEKRITVVKICEIYRKHGDNKQYNDGRTKGMEASKYKGADFSYMLVENATGKNASA